MATHKRNWAQSATISFASSAFGAKLFAPTMHHLDRMTLRLTGGRHTMVSLVSGLPIITLTTTGAKSGQPRAVPLVATPDGANLIVIASNWGQAHYPAWYHNLRAHPEAQVTQDGQTRPYRARELDGKDRARAWDRAVRLYPGYAAYATRTKGRPIPVFRLSPQAAPKPAPKPAARTPG